VNDYRPISLLNCVLKVLTKLLAERLQKWILKVVHRNQYGFIKGRNIQDCLAWSFEYLHQCKASGREIVVLKLDFEKAFDTVEHSTILEILHHMGFDERWTNWIKLILESGSSSILVNGVPGTDFKCKRGVRQGDPLSPLLFVSMAELLQVVINVACSEGVLHLPIDQPASEDFPVVQYADDTIIILQADRDQLASLHSLLDAYSQSTGLKINFHKSQMIPINITNEKAQELASVLGCQVGQMPFTYLGLPLGTTRPTVAELMPLVDRVERRLTSTAIWLTYGGRVTFINSALSPLLIYALCVLKIPLQIIEFVDRARRHCLWRKSEDREEKTYSLAAWDLVCRPKKKGGLGIMDLKVQNQGLLLKYLHKFYHKMDVPWVMLIWYKYYGDKVPHATTKIGSFWWRDVFSLSDIYRGITTCTVNAGDSVLLWKDLWFEDALMKERLPHLFSFTLKEDCSMLQFLENDTPSSDFFLPLSMEASSELDWLNDTIRNIQREPYMPDRWIYVWGQEEYKVQKFYKFYFQEVVPLSCLPAIWKTKCTMKHKIFAWLLFMDRLNTRDMLVRRQCPIPDNKCVLCNTVLETREHLFFECQISRQCWDVLNMQWDTNLAISDMIAVASTQWRRPLFLEYAILGAWNIWKIRNRKHFDGIIPTTQTWLQQLLADLDLLGSRLKPELRDKLVTFSASLRV
jgi:hypothetical protein